jgi:hypothetical protein
MPGPLYRSERAAGQREDSASGRGEDLVDLPYGVCDDRRRLSGDATEEGYIAAHGEPPERDDEDDDQNLEELNDDDPA